jgi:hypothetical protein
MEDLQSTGFGRAGLALHFFLSLFVVAIRPSWFTFMGTVNSEPIRIWIRNAG